LFDIVVGLEKNFLRQHFRERTSQTPYIDGLAVFMRWKHDFGGTVVSCYDIFSQLTYSFTLLEFLLVLDLSA